jgi:mannose-6-phosphate isomerase-like protein (cupin superfamily)
MSDAANAMKPAATRKEPKSPPKVIQYVLPDPQTYTGKGVVRLVQSDILFGNVQVIREGGDNNLHSHAGMDGFWFVLSGRAKFYGPTNDAVIAEVGPREGVFIPRNFPYWFEKVGNETLEILQIEAIDRSVRNERIDYSDVKSASTQASIFAMDGTLMSKGYAREP